jgi:PKD repeat protein
MKNYFRSGVLLGMAILVFGCTKEPPVAKFSIDKETFKANEKLTFINESVNAETYEWNFGDGKKSTVENPDHTYAGSGEFTVKLISTGKGGVDSIAQVITVLPNLSGMWRKTLSLGGSFGINGTMNLTQHDDNTLTGSYVYEDGMGTIRLNPASKVNGNNVEIIWEGDYYKFQGTISADGKTMAGNVLADNVVAGTWVAKKL